MSTWFSPWPGGPPQGSDSAWAGPSGIAYPRPPNAVRKLPLQAVERTRTLVTSGSPDETTVPVTVAGGAVSWPIVVSTLVPTKRGVSMAAGDGERAVGVRQADRAGRGLTIAPGDRCRVVAHRLGPARIEERRQDRAAGTAEDCDGHGADDDRRVGHIDRTGGRCGRSYVDDRCMDLIASRPSINMDAADLKHVVGIRPGDRARGRAVVAPGDGCRVVRGRLRAYGVDERGYRQDGRSVLDGAGRRAAGQQKRVGHGSGADRRAVRPSRG